MIGGDMRVGRRVLILASGALLLAALAHGGASRLAALSDGIGEAEQEVARLQGLVAAAHADRRAAEQLDDLVDASFVGGEHEHVAAATLQAQVVRVIEANAATVRSVRIEPTQADTDLPSLQLTVTFESSYPAALDILRSIESTRPLLTVSTLSLQATEQPGGTLDALRIDASITVKAFRRSARP